MKIRSITYFLHPGWPLKNAAFQQAAAFIASARSRFQDAGYEVQTVRLATIPFPRLAPDCDPGELVRLAQAMDTAAAESGFDYVALGPADPDLPASYLAVPDMLAAAPRLFLSGWMTTPEKAVSLPAVRACAQVITHLATLTPDGFTNLRFGALANLPPGGPFLPGAYHNGSTPAFALATEAAGLAVQAFTDASSLVEGRRRLIETVEGHANRLGKMTADLAAEFCVPFAGFDFTLAPFPSEDLSFGAAMERLGLPAVGLPGSLAAAALITDTLDQARYPRVGFNGLMLPVLEDAVLSARAAQGLLSVTDLLLYSTVCGAGLDTIPLPRDITTGQIAALLLDLAALALRLDKPLIARLMPVPGKAAGDPTSFDFAFFAPSRILSLEARPLGGLLAGDETFRLEPRRRTGTTSS